MMFPEKSIIDRLKVEWSDKLVRVKPGIAENLKRFEGMVGRVVTVNYSGRAVVDFADGAWYDVDDFAKVLEVVTDESEKKKYDPNFNSAQKLPQRQG